MKSLKPGLAALACLFTSLAQASTIEVEVEKDSRLPIGYVNVVIRGGSVSDPENRVGLTQFMSQMLVRGTKSLTKEQIDLRLDQWGAQLAVENRAEYTIIRGAALSTRLPDLLGLIEDILLHPSFSDSEIRKLKAETISGLMEELASDHAVNTKKFSRLLFDGHPYGRPTAGLASHVQTFDRAALAKQHLLIMNSDRAFFLASGDVDEASFSSWAARVARGMPGKGALSKLARPAQSSARRLQIIDKPDRTQTQIQIGQIGTLMSDPDYPALYLGNAAFGGGSFMSRMMQEIRVKRGWSYGAASTFRFGVQPRSWQAHLFPATKDTPAALAFTLGMIAELQKNGITQAEFDLVKRSSINSAAFMSDTPKKRIENRILERTLGLEKGFFEGFASRLEKTSREQVNEALSRFLKSENLSISVLGTAAPLKTGLIEAAGVTEKELKIVPYSEE